MASTGIGRLLAFTPPKSYSHVVLSAPGLSAGNSYELVSGGTISGADANGFASSGTVSGGESLLTVTMDSDNYGSSAFGGFGGSEASGGMGGGRGGFGAR